MFLSKLRRILWVPGASLGEVLGGQVAGDSSIQATEIVAVTHIGRPANRGIGGRDC
jgi:hypothetical protein